MNITDKALIDSRQRGFDAGLDNARHGRFTQTPLSGEWAGESVAELLDDLLAVVADEVRDEVLEEYEVGYALGQDAWE